MSANDPKRTLRQQISTIIVTFPYFSLHKPVIWWDIGLGGDLQGGVLWTNRRRRPAARE